MHFSVFRVLVLYGWPSWIVKEMKSLCWTVPMLDGSLQMDPVDLISSPSDVVAILTILVSSAMIQVILHFGNHQFYRLSQGIFEQLFVVYGTVINHYTCIMQHTYLECFSIIKYHALGSCYHTIILKCMEIAYKKSQTEMGASEIQKEILVKAQDTRACTTNFTI